MIVNIIPKNNYKEDFMKKIIFIFIFNLLILSFIATKGMTRIRYVDPDKMARYIQKTLLFIIFSSNLLK